MKGDRGPILYVVTLFPCWSETFIVREIEALLQRGLRVNILSLKHAHESLVHPGAQALLGSVLYPTGGARSAGTALLTCLRHPLIVGDAITTACASLWRRPAALIKTLAAFWRAVSVLPSLRRAPPVHIHAHWATYASSAAWLLSRLTGTPFSFTSHAHDLYLDDQFIARKILDARFAITISDYNRRLIESRYGASLAGRVRVVHCGVDVRNVGLPPGGGDPHRILAIGRLDPIKGFDVLVDSLALLRDAGLKFACEIIGEGPERARLEALIAGHRLGAEVSLPGARSQQEVHAAIGRAGMFVLPSVVAADGNQDGIPVALMEAMAGMLPVISTTVSGIPELIEDGVSGILVPPGDAVALSAAIRKLSADAGLRRSLGGRARARVLEDFDADREGGKVAAFIQGHAT